MGPIKLDFTECLKDSPNFRKNLSKIEDDLDTFEHVCRKVTTPLVFPLKKHSLYFFLNFRLTSIQISTIKMD
jgi:hypothetical protein